VSAGIEEYQEHVWFVGVPAKIQTEHHLNTSLKHFHFITKYNAATGSKNPRKYEDYRVDLISTPAFGRKVFHLSSQSLLPVITLIPSNRNWKKWWKRFKFTML
jgi:hypothetical protein